MSNCLLLFVIVLAVFTMIVRTVIQVKANQVKANQVKKTKRPKRTFPSTMPTTRPAHDETPWHISIGFFSTRYGPIKDASAVNRANYKKALERIQRNYAEWQQVTLTGHPQGGTWVLNDDSPVRTDPDIQHIHANSQYWEREIHMTW